MVNTTDLTLNQIFDISTRTKVYVFSDSVLCLGKILENPESNEAWEQKLRWIKSFQKLQKLWQNRWWVHGIRVEYFPKIQYVAAQRRSQKFIVLIGKNTGKNSQEEFYFMSMFNDPSCGTKNNEKECLANARLVSLYARRFGNGQWSFIGPDFEKKWTLSERTSPQRDWNKIEERMLLEFIESGCPIFHATTPLPSDQLKKQKTW